MRSSRVFSLSRKLVVLACLGLTAPTAIADDDDRKGHDGHDRKGHDDHDRKGHDGHDRKGYSDNYRASAVFGRGLNTAQPGNLVNHVVLPKKIKVKVGGVVDFSVAGFHDIIIFKPGFELSDLVDAGGGVLPQFGGGLFVLPPDPGTQMPSGLEFLADEIYYWGIRPAGGPPTAEHPAQDNPDNGSNRGEPVAFLEKGTYLVICNVRPHLEDGMYAHVKVR